LQGKTAETARALVEDALALEAAGAFALVLEVVPREIARVVTASVSIPTIGIGAGEHCDAQVLVIHDLLGLSFSPTRPRFVRQYTDLRAQMTEAISRFAEDVRTGAYPAETESYPLPREAAAELEATPIESGDAEARQP
jgi:3-methyl-2-oxobutanoate hydroxymethyltransferase